MKIRAIQSLSNVALFSSGIFIPILAKELGASDFEIGFVTALYNGMLLFAAFVFGRWADIIGRELFLRLGLLLSAVAVASQILAIATDSFLVLTLSRAALGFCAGIYPPALLAYAYESKISVGSISGFMALGWSVGWFLAGIITIFWEIFFIGSVLMLISFYVSLTVTKKPVVNMKVPLFPRDVIRRGLPSYLTMMIRHTGAFAIWVFFPLLLMEYTDNIMWIGLLFALNPLVQFPLMHFVDPIDERLQITIGLILSIVCFSGMYFSTDLLMLCGFFVAVGAAWSFLYVGCLKYVIVRNKEHATASGLFQTSFQISGILGAILGGVISQIWGYRAPIAFATILAAVALVVFWSFKDVRNNIRPVVTETQEEVTIGTTES